MRKVVLTVCLLAMVVGRSFAESKPILYYDDLNALLRRHLDVVQQREGRNRKITGGVTIGIGALLGIGGFILYQNRARDDYGLYEVLGYVGMGGGGVCLAVGVPVLFIPSKAERVWRQYEGLPAGTDKEKTALFRRGESDLRDLADYYKSSRIIGAGVNLALGLGSLASVAAGVSASIGSVAALEIGVGIAGLLIPSTAEKEWGYYQEEKKEASAE